MPPEVFLKHRAALAGAHPFFLDSPAARGLNIRKGIGPVNSNRTLRPADRLSR
jgi:hypothetical protein